LNETAKPTKTQTLTESQTTEVTGNKAASTEQVSSEAEIINLKKLAGIK
jgi:carbohydrate-binding DOMON domain-containing protein